MPKAIELNSLTTGPNKIAVCDGQRLEQGLREEGQIKQHGIVYLYVHFRNINIVIFNKPENISVNIL